ncbi:MAG: hypothetical protein PHC85_00995 [Candidatus Pacebacteria bacterium]|nr:hypothetical protein [Candidatus Paceibacterota bacterium]
MNLKRRFIEVQKCPAVSDVDLPLEIKLRIAKICLTLRQRRTKFGLFVILGWKKKWNKYAVSPDISQDIFLRHHTNIMTPGIRPAASQDKNRDITKTINFDGAILIDESGDILHSGTMIENLRPKKVAQKINPQKSSTDLSTQFGFKQKVHMRHLSAITSSYIFKGTTVFTVSEETGHFPIFENGKILYSTILQEQELD